MVTAFPSRPDGARAGVLRRGVRIRRKKADLMDIRR
jgi:hypothetical protein